MARRDRDDDVRRLAFFHFGAGLLRGKKPATAAGGIIDSKSNNNNIAMDRILIYICTLAGPQGKGEEAKQGMSCCE